MRRRVVAVGLDAAAKHLLDAWIDQGQLPALAALRARSAHARLQGRDHYRAETPWTCFLTGCEPEQIGYWTLLRFSPRDYQNRDVGAYDFREYPPFYALGDEYRVVAFDLPQSRPSAGVNGVQVICWGAHSPMAPPESRPPQVLDDLQRRFGRHPALLHDEATLWRPRELTRLEQQLSLGIARRGEICSYLMKREAWDLFVTAFGETHTAGHYFWHISQPDHPLSGVCGRADGDPLLRVYQQVDRGLARMMAETPDDAYFVICVTEGMEANSMDLPSMVFLPELLYRANFPGNRALGTAGDLSAPRIPLRSWVPAVWSTQSGASRLRQMLRTGLPSVVSYRADRLWRRKELEPLSPDAAGALAYQPATWYRPLWPRMRAFALPSFSEGYVRLNVRGREAGGIVDAAEYDRVCSEVSAEIAALTDARTGKPMVREVRRTRHTAHDDSPRLPDADLIVLWSPQPTDSVDHPTHGRIGPLPFYRSGGHNETGFTWISGPGIVPGTQLPTGRPTSMAPTLLTLLGARVPEYMKQPSLI